jgi:Asp-tRNA(Asn)/Glu-tRNA(Gln) amidotransferase A subunit family amidase
MTNEIIYVDVTRMAKLVAKREVSLVEIVEPHLDRIAEVNPKVNADGRWRTGRCQRSRDSGRVGRSIGSSP